MSNLWKTEPDRVMIQYAVFCIVAIFASVNVGLFVSIPTPFRAVTATFVVLLAIHLAISSGKNM